MFFKSLSCHQDCQRSSSSLQDHFCLQTKSLCGWNENSKRSDYSHVLAMIFEITHSSKSILEIKNCLERSWKRIRVRGNSFVQFSEVDDKTKSEMCLQFFDKFIHDTIPRHDKVLMEVLFQTFKMRIVNTSGLHNNTAWRDLLRFSFDVESSIHIFLNQSSSCLLENRSENIRLRGWYCSLGLGVKSWGLKVIIRWWGLVWIF